MTGFEKTMFVSLTEEMEREMMCNICLNIFNNPLTAPCCRTSYCGKCIQDCLRLSSSGNSTCPSCRAGLLASNLLPLPLFVKNILDNLEVYCDNEINGCTQIVKLGELSQHLTRCPFNPNFPTLKCNQLFKNINIMQTNITKRDYDNLKKELDVMQMEVLKINSPDNSDNDKQMSSNVSTQPINNVSEQTLIESASYQLDGTVIIYNNRKPPGLLTNFKNKCRQTLIDFIEFYERKLN